MVSIPILVPIFAVIIFSFGVITFWPRMGRVAGVLVCFKRKRGTPLSPSSGRYEVASSGCMKIDSLPLNLILMGPPSPPRPASATKLSVLY